MESQVIDELRARLERVEDELAIRRVILSYGPAADAGLASSAASLWFDDGVYDWDGNGEPYDGSAAIERMRRRTNRLLDGSGGGRHLFAETLGDMSWDG
jgi:hypothetical protein